ncbi:MAG: thiamine phosphate synthase [Bacteroidales bacterium]|nr:thiamine phosphate synthase [Bacteroidales bacterium]
MLQFITNKTDRYNHIDGAKLALEGGCKWIQLRMKNYPKSEIIEVAKEINKLCKQYNAILIIDDYPDIAMEVKADGVHLGKNDMNPIEARNLMGEEYIIGGTANSFEDIQRLIAANVDYIGLGPYRFTKTKEKLSPILGIKGYEDIINKCKEHNYKTPIVAIGGIEIEDIPSLVKMGVNGVAISGYILNSENPTLITNKIIDTLYENRD